MHKLPKEDQPTYVLSYSRAVRLGRYALLILLIGAALVRWILAWVHSVKPLTQGVEWTVELLRPLIAAHVGLLLTAGAVAFASTFLPDLSLTDHGLAVRTLLGWEVIPWTKVSMVRIISFEESDRRLVLIQGHWARWSIWPRLVSLCLGAGFAPGILLTSSIRDFKPLMLRLYKEVTQAAPEATFDDQFFSLPARLTLEPVPTLRNLVDEARDEGWPLALSGRVMAAIPVGLVLVSLLILILEGGAWWNPLVIAGLCGVEWLIGAFYLYALAELFPANVELREAGLLYPLPQVPRALLAVPMAMLVASGVPFLAAMLGLAGVLWAVILTALLVQQMYHLKSILPTLIGGAFQVLYQFLILAFVLTQ